MNTWLVGSIFVIFIKEMGTMVTLSDYFLSVFLVQMFYLITVSTYQVFCYSDFNVCEGVASTLILTPIVHLHR